MNGRCEICGDAIDPGGIQDILDHLRVLHPETYGDGPERWPDGGLVIDDTDLIEEQFEGPS
jgi:hypothetical protein